MIVRKVLRNRLTGFFFGKYDVANIAKKNMHGDEEYISGMEIIHYNEVLIGTALLLGIISIFTSFLVHPLLLLLLIVSALLIFFALDLELIILSNERIIIERRGIVEKILRTQNIKALSIDQIAMYTYSRAPFHRAAHIIGLSGLSLVIAGLYYLNGLLVTVLLILALPVFLYTIWFGLRLGKRSIEIYVVGILQPIGIGRMKGIPIWFLKDMQMVIIERIHHVGHQSHEDTESKLSEFPLDNSDQVKELIKTLNSQLEKEIVRVLELGNYSKKELREICKNSSFSDMEGAMTSLRLKELIYYDRSIRKWRLDMHKVGVTTCYFC